MAVPRKIKRLNRIAYKRTGVLPRHLAALEQTESNFDPSAVSSAGARGLTQFMPGTAPGYGVKFGTSHRAQASQVIGAAKYLKSLGYKRGNKAAISNALASYAGGPGNPQSDYAALVLQRSKAYKGSGAGTKYDGHRTKRTTTKTKTVGGRDNSALRKDLKLAYLEDRHNPDALLSLASGLRGAADVPGRKVTTKTTKTSKGKPLGTKAALGDYKRAGRLVEREVLPIARKLGIQVTPRSVHDANARHGPTISGGRSDHQGPFADAWAADMSNGSAPTKEMDKLARRLARKFHIPWDGSGLVSVTHGGYRYQLIYRTTEGGNHFNHVHFGVRKV